MKKQSMTEKLAKMKEKLEAQNAEKRGKKGAASIETIVVSGLLIALAVGIILGFNGTIQESSKKTNTTITKTVGDAAVTAGSEAIKKP